MITKWTAGCPMAGPFRALCSLSPRRRTPPLRMDMKWLTECDAAGRPAGEARHSATTACRRGSASGHAPAGLNVWLSLAPVVIHALMATLRAARPVLATTTGLWLRYPPGRAWNAAHERYIIVISDYRRR